MMTNPLQAIPLSQDIIEAINECLTREVTDEEIFDTLKQINLIKSPGPNSMQAIFYQTS